MAQTKEFAALHTGQCIPSDGRELSLSEAVRALAERDARAGYIRQTAGYDVYPMGTAPMGPEGDDAAVVDQYCRVRGVEGLRVVDASIMPAIPRANTTLTCIMIGERVAAWMQRDTSGVASVPSAAMAPGPGDVRRRE